MALKFFTRCEAANLDGTHDFSAGDTTGTIVSGAAFNTDAVKYGTNGLDCPTAGDYVSYAISSNDLISPAVGAVGFAFRLQSFAATRTLFRAFNSGTPNNNISIETTGTDGAGTRELLLRNRLNGVTNVTLATTAADLELNTWYHVIARWDEPNNDRRIEVYDSAGALITAVEDLATDFDQPTGMDTLGIGEVLGSLFDCHIDNFFIADAYAEPIEDNFDITSYTAYGGGALPDITDVDTDEIVTATQQNIALTGTALGTIDEIRVYDQDDLLFFVANVDAADDDSAQFDMPSNGLLGGATGIRYGAATVRYLRDDAEFDDHAITIIAPTGKNYVDLTSVDGTAANRLTASADLEAGDQVEWSNVIGGTIADVTVNPDATFTAAMGVTSFDVRFHDVATGWGSTEAQTIASPEPVITTLSLPDADRTQAYSETLEANGDTPIAWSLEIGALPAGLSLNASTGEISGTPTTVETATFTVGATNAYDTYTQELSIEVLPVIPSITTTTLPDGYDTFAYSCQLAATGDDGTWDISAGALPSGLTLSAAGLISGTPDTEETANFTARKTNAKGNDTQALSIEILAASAHPSTGSPFAVLDFRIRI